MSITAPTVAPPAEWRFPQPEETFLDNGMRVLVHRMPGQQVISATLLLDLPASAEPRELEGVGLLCARCLDEGSEAHPGDRFAEVLENEGAEFHASQGFSGAQVMLDVPASHLGAALQIFADGVRNPSLADDVVQRGRRLRLVEIERQQANSAQLAGHTFRSIVYAPGSRVQRMAGGEADTVTAITPAAVREFHQRHYGPRGTTLVLAGDFAEAPLPQVSKAFGDWMNPDQVEVAHETPTAGERRMLLVDRPGAVQADLRLGGFGIDRADPRWADARIGAYVVGGAFLSRLNRVLREERGFTYGVSLGLSPLRRGGSYATAGSFRTEVLVPAVTEALGLMDLAAAPVEPAELLDAQNFFCGIAPLRYSTAGGVADQIVSMVADGLPLEWINDLLARTRETTCEQASQAYSQVIDLSALSMVVVGDAANLAEPLQQAGLPVEVIERAPR